MMRCIYLFPRSFFNIFLPVAILVAVIRSNANIELRDIEKVYFVW